MRPYWNLINPFVGKRIRDAFRRLQDLFDVDHLFFWSGELTHDKRMKPKKFPSRSGSESLRHGEHMLNGASELGKLFEVSREQLLDDLVTLPQDPPSRRSKARTAVEAYVQRQEELYRWLKQLKILEPCEFHKEGAIREVSEAVLGLVDENTTAFTGDWAEVVTDAIWCQLNSCLIEGVFREIPDEPSTPTSVRDIRRNLKPIFEWSNRLGIRAAFLIDRSECRGLPGAKDWYPRRRPFLDHWSLVDRRAREVLRHILDEIWDLERTQDMCDVEEERALKALEEVEDYRVGTEMVHPRAASPTAENDGNRSSRSAATTNGSAPAEGISSTQRSGVLLNDVEKLEHPTPGTLPDHGECEQDQRKRLAPSIQEDASLRAPPAWGKSVVAVGVESDSGQLPQQSVSSEAPARPPQSEDPPLRPLPSPARPRGVKVRIDEAMQSVLLDDQTIPVLHRAAFRFFAALVRARGRLLTGLALGKLCSFLRVDRLVRKLPEILRPLIGTQPGHGGGYWFRRESPALLGS